VLAQLALPHPEPGNQLFPRGMERDRGGVGNDRPPVLPEGYPAEPCYQIVFTLAPEPGLETGQLSAAVVAFAL
jgi:hypothetical protein